MRSPLTPARRARLEKLAAYLESLPKRYRHFDMGRYLVAVSDENEARAVNYALRNGGVPQCGAVACALGHGPAAGILVPRRLVRTEDRDGYNWVYWDRYAEDLFVGSFLAAAGNASHALYRWCFGGEWEDVDNHHYGAAARIRYALAHGARPADYNKPSAKWRKVYAPYRIDAKAQADA